MYRVNKGNGIKRHVSDYCVVDLETTGCFINSADIVEISAIKVRNNLIVEEFESLVNPHRHIPFEATAVNNITDEMVIDAPDLDELIDVFLDFVGDDIIVGYNNAGFDMNIIYDAVMNLRGIPFTNDYVDILHMAKRCLPMIDNHRLETVSKYYSLDTIGSHRALKDCYLTKECYDRLYAEFGDDAFGRNTARRGFKPANYSTETVALQELVSFLKNVIRDEKVDCSELIELKHWMENHRYLQGSYPFDRVFDALDSVLEDGKITSTELESFYVFLLDLVDPVKQRGCHDKIAMLYGKHVCVTGDFEFGSRSKVCALIEEAGGIIDKSVKNATNYVVVGTKGSDNWKTGNYGSKIQKAMELIDKGMEIKIVEEKEFIPSVIQMVEDVMGNKNEFFRERSS